MIRFVLKAGTHANPQLRACGDCASLAGAVTLWCMNDDAHRQRKTRIPGVKGCPFWQPMPQQPTGVLRRLFSDAIVVNGLPEPPQGVYGPGL